MFAEFEEIVHEKIDNETGFTDIYIYIDMLKQGGSKSSIDLLKMWYNE